MRPPVRCLIVSLVLSLSACTEPLFQPTPEDDFYFGYTGGWLGGPRLLLRHDRLFALPLGSPVYDADPPTDPSAWTEITDHTKVTAAIDLRNQFIVHPARRERGCGGCAAAVYDGACPIILTVSTAGARRRWIIDPDHDCRADQLAEFFRDELVPTVRTIEGD